MKKNLFLVFALFFSFLANAQAQSTNVVVLTEAQYAALTNGIHRVSDSVTNIIIFLQGQSQISGSQNSYLQNIITELQNFDMDLMWNGYFYYFTQDQNADGSSSGIYQYANLPESLESLQANIVSLHRLVHLIVDGSLSGSYDTSTYNFVQFYDLVDDYFNAAKGFLDDIDLLVYDIRQYTRDCYTMLYDIKNSINRLLTSFEFWSNINTNQINTIIALLDRQDTNQTDVITNTLEVITNILEQIGGSFDESKDLFEEMKDDLKSIKDYLEDSYPGSGSGGTNDTSVVDFSYFDRWLKEWVELYFYPADSTYSLETFDHYGVLNLRLAYPSFGFRMASLEVPYLGLNRNQLWDNGRELITLDYPEWESPFLNTTVAYNSGHTNFYDITSALLTDIQSVNAQHYALFYTLATNILLSGVDDDASEVSNQFAQIEEMADRITSLTNNIASAISDGVKPVEDKFKEFSDECKAVTDYLSVMSKIPVNDYYFNLPTFEIFGEELGGMEIVLHLTDESFLTVLEVLHVFFLMMWWVTVLGVFFLIGRLCYKMFFWLYKTFLFTTFMSSES